MTISISNSDLCEEESLFFYSKIDLEYWKFKL